MNDLAGGKTTYIAIGVGVLIVALAVFFAYSADQAKQRGLSFGNALQGLQDELRQTQDELYSKKMMLDEGAISQDEFLVFADTHILKMEQIVEKYDTLYPPDAFSSSVRLFKLSTQKQIESDLSLIEWIRTNDTAAKVRSDILLQESFESEMAALASYAKAKGNSDGS